jgi:hypothetical protein
VPADRRLTLPWFGVKGALRLPDWAARRQIDHQIEHRPRAKPKKSSALLLLSIFTIGRIEGI